MILADSVVKLTVEDGAVTENTKATGKLMYGQKIRIASDYSYPVLVI